MNNSHAEHPAEADVINLLHNTNLDKLLNRTPRTTFESVRHNLDAKSMIGIHERVGAREEYFRGIAKDTIENPLKLIFRMKPNDKDPDPSRRDGYVFLGKNGDADVEVYPFITPRMESALKAQTSGNVLDGRSPDELYVRDIPINDDIRDALKDVSAGYGAEGNLGTTIIKWDEQHEELVSFYNHPKDETKSGEPELEVAWVNKISRDRDGHSLIDNVNVQVQPGKIPHISLSNRYGNKQSEIDRKTGLFVHDEVSFPGPNYEIYRNGRVEKFYPEGGSNDGWITESRYLAKCNDNGWDVNRLDKYDYEQKQFVEKSTTSVTDRKQISADEVKSALILQQAGIELGGQSVPDMNMALKMVLESIPLGTT